MNGLLPKPSRKRLEVQSQAFYEDSIEVKQTINLADLNRQLELKTYLTGDLVSEEDWRIFGAFSLPPCQERYPHIYRWHAHMKSLSVN